MHVIYILAANSKDKKYDVIGTIEKIVLTGNEIFYKNTKKNFRLDLTKQGKLDVSFIRVDKKKRKINKIENGAGYFAAEAIKRGFYNLMKLYAIIYQDKYNREWGQVGDADFYGPNKMVEVAMGVTYMGGGQLSEAWIPYLHEQIHALGFVQLCAPGAIIQKNSKWRKNDHLNYSGDIMSDRDSDDFIDKKRKEYYGHSIPNCDMDLKKSAFFTTY